jgi:hypothetical protein
MVFHGVFFRKRFFSYFWLIPEAKSKVPDWGIKSTLAQD